LFFPAGISIVECVSLRQAFDLGGKFVNPYIERVLEI